MFAGAILAASLALTPAQSKRIDALVQQVMHAVHIPGLSLGIGRHGRLLFARGYGVRDLANGAPADPRTIYRVGSITKEFTATLVELEAERGALPFNAEIHGITIPQLLGQTSGLVSYTDPGETLDSAMNAPLRFTPGTQWEYSNSNYYLLGTALESVSHKTYPQLLQALILKPVHLPATTYLPTGKDVALGYAWNGTQLVPVEPGPNDAPSLAFAASALSSNVVDLLHWLFKLQDGAIVPSDSFEQMTNSWTLTDGTPTNYGFGFFIDDWYGWHIAHTTGLMDGYSGDAAISLEDGLDLVVLTNADKVSVVPLVKSLFAIVDPPKDRALVADLSHPAQNEDPAITSLVKTVVRQLARGTLDRSLLTPDFSATLSDSATSADAARLQGLGTLTLVEYLEASHVAGETSVKYRLTFDRGTAIVNLQLLADKIDALTIDLPR
ncbi:MAG TPA: serine hydrolase domain-containing protein [Candidatus Baltobacteraceae bacterium]|nr:serine hydrolase domain-containing protein [Candidatus Baltobacteraceae bacterium]